MKDMVLLGDEAVAMGAIHAGLTAGYAYPGTPSTEIMEFLIRYYKKHGKPHAAWCTNEKTSYEQALGVSFVGRRALVAMKHVGLNVAADPFVNSALVNIKGGLVVVVADDPGMHSSQNEQDSRCLADFAKIVCLEPADQQEAYQMTKEAFDLSEKFKIPIMIRLVTRLAHSRAVVNLTDSREENPLDKVQDPSTWILMPHNARRQWTGLLDRQKDFNSYTAGCPHNVLSLDQNGSKVGVITTGLAKNYYSENVDELHPRPSHLHIGAYPFPSDKIRELARNVEKLVIMEEGYPFLERYMRGIFPPSIEIIGKESGHIPKSGELNPDNIRPALGLPKNTGISVDKLPVAGRPPLLCKGCPHIDTYESLKIALQGFEQKLVSSDIGCYTLGALPPYSAVETCVCMGASIGMASGAAEAGLYPSIAVIGDSTFLHSGVTSLIDAVAANTDMTLLIMDNEGVAMTGGQPTILPSSKIRQIVLGTGADPKHCHVLDTRPKNVKKNGQVIRKEIEYHGLSVIIAVRKCIEIVKKSR